MTYGAYLAYVLGLSAIQLGMAAVLIPEKKDWEKLRKKVQKGVRVLLGQDPNPPDKVTLEYFSPKNRLYRLAIEEKIFNNDCQERILLEEMAGKITDVSRIEQDIKAMVDSTIIPRYSRPLPYYPTKSFNEIKYLPITKENARPLLINLYSRFNNIGKIITEHRLNQLRKNKESGYTSKNFSMIDSDKIDFRNQNIIDKLVSSQVNMENKPSIEVTEADIIAEGEALREKLISTAINIFNTQMDLWNKDHYKLLHEHDKEKTAIRRKDYFPRIQNILTKEYRKKYEYNIENINKIADQLGKNEKIKESQPNVSGELGMEL